MASTSTGVSRLKGLRLQHALARALKRNPKSSALKSDLKTVQMLNSRLRQLAMEERLATMRQHLCSRPGSCRWPYCVIDLSQCEALR